TSPTPPLPPFPTRRSSDLEDVEFSAEDATRSDIEYLCEVFSTAVEEGARTLNVPDTVGYTTPTEFREIVSTVRERVVSERDVVRSEEHTSELQSPYDLVCR